MKWRSPRFFLPVLLIVVSIIGIIIYIHTITSQGITVVWQNHSQLFTQQDQQDIQNAWKSALLSSNSSNIAGHEFTIMNVQRQGAWAIFSANEKTNPNSQPIPSEPLFFIAHQQSTTWTVWIPSSSGFCNELKQLPNTLLDQSDKQYFLGCYQ